METLIVTLAVLFTAGDAHAHAGKAAAETAEQGRDNVKAATSNGPPKTVHKAIAKHHAATAAAKKSVKQCGFFAGVAR